MNSRRKLNKQMNLAARYHARKVGLFTKKKCVLFLLVTATILAIPSWQAWRSYADIRTTKTQLEQLIRIEGTTMYRDEVLAMSAKMAVATRNLKWASRHKEFGPRVEATVEEIWNVFENESVDALNAEAALTVFVDDKLDTMENEALSLVHQGKHELAAALLQSPEYEEQRQAYNEGMKTFVGNVRRALEERRDIYWQKVRAVFIATGIVLPVIALTWFVVHKMRKRFHERTETKQKLNAFAREWQETFNAITDVVCIVDRNGGKILQCNSAMTRFLKRPFNEIIGRSCCELLHGSSEPVKRCPLVRMYETRRSQTKDFQIGDRWLNIKVDPLINNDGYLVGAVHITSDITEQRKANRALQESENKFRLAFANAQDAIVWIDVESRVITNCNKAAEELFGKKRKEIVGQHHTTLYPAEKAEHYHSLLGESGKDLNSNIEAEILTTSGQTRTVTIAVSTMMVDGKEIIQGIIRDITESKRAIEEIKNLAKFPSEDPNPVLRITQDCKILYANDAASPVLKTWQIQEGQLLPELWCKRIEDVYGSDSSATYELNCDDGHTFFITLQPIVGSGYVNAYGLDITERKKAEKEKLELELQLSQKQKMEAIGTLAGGIAHDFNNILGAMQGYLELSFDDLPKKSAVRDNLKQILFCVNRATKLVKQILTFSRKDQQEQEKEPVQISSIIKEVLGMLRSSLPATIKISRKIHADSSMVLADSTQIHQVLVNLCTNASHSMQGADGLLEVSLEDVNLESETRIGDEHLGPGNYVKLSISDTGCGMEKEVAERIFEPFFTTKKVNEGTGLGLSVVHGIIKSHNGAITVSSTPGEGTTFDIFLPKIESGDIKKPQLSKSTTKEKEVILLVDDEEMMVDVTRQILERLGFDVVAKTSSTDALEAFQEEPDRFDLVITDQVMPNMTGTQLARELISVRPDISIVLCSGFPENVCPEELKSIGIKEFITKPISRKEIATIIRKVLDKSSVTA
ncbi:MAG: PAS domain S-box protein [Phycisphaerae bacterium]